MPEWHPHPDVWLLLVVLGGGYAQLVRTVGRRSVPPDERAASRGQMAAYAAGLLVLWISADWPLHDIGEESLFTAHMVQHMLMTLVAPPLLILGTPGWMLRWLLRPRWLLRAARFLSRPVVALVIFNTLIAVIHWPAFVDAYLRSESLHLITHLALLTTAAFMWMPVLSPIVEIRRLSYPGQTLYVFAQSIIPTIPASFLTFGTAPLYRAYEEAPRLWGISALTDQRIAGLTMKIVGGLILWGIIAVLFFKWAKEEESGVDRLGWRALEQEANRGELAGR